MNKKLLLTAAFIFAFLFCGVTGARYYVIGEQNGAAYSKQNNTGTKKSET
jgi:hypothetical protein